MKSTLSQEMRRNGGNHGIKKVAIIGAGIWGHTHASIYNEHPYVTLAGVCDINYAKAKELANKFGVLGEHVYTDHKEMLEKCDFDIDPREKILQEENRKLNTRIADLEAGNSYLKKLNDWYIEKFKLRKKEKLGRSSEKDNDGQPSFFDIFNESETLKEPIVVEPKAIRL
ncbi:MAG: hypothetical protein EWM47_08270 [Anaerolineaceae bacterium]|nr:MAG: hypothetical protein EWM47_08270 [Anaerolineaceae bacterium]